MQTRTLLEQEPENPEEFSASISQQTSRVAPVVWCIFALVLSNSISAVALHKPSILPSLLCVEAVAAKNEKREDWFCIVACLLCPYFSFSLKSDDMWHWCILCARKCVLFSHVRFLWYISHSLSCVLWLSIYFAQPGLNLNPINSFISQSKLHRSSI